jgi:hypothetical protein
MLRKKWVLVIGGALAVLLLASLITWSTAKRSAPPFLAGLTQNSYDDFVKAGKLLIGTVEDGDLETFVRTNRPALDTVRAGLKKRFEAPAETYDMQAFANLVMPNMSYLKQLGKAIKAEGTLAEDSGKYTEASTIYLDLIECGQKIQAGPLIFLLMGLAVEDMGHKSLQGIEKHLKEPDRQEIATRLSKLAENRIPFEEILARERFFARRNSPTPFHYLFFARMMKAGIDSAERKYDTMVKAEQQLLDQFKQPESPK